MQYQFKVVARTLYFLYFFYFDCVVLKIQEMIICWIFIIIMEQIQFRHEKKGGYGFHAI